VTSLVHQDVVVLEHDLRCHYSWLRYRLQRDPL